MPLISIYDPAPVTLRGKAHRADRKGFLTSVVYVETLSHRVLAQVFSVYEAESVEIAERVGWGMWRAGLHYDGQPIAPWDPANFSLPKVHPAPNPDDFAWSRQTASPETVIFVYGSLQQGRERWGSVRYSAACADLGLVSGPARWDHRTQFSTARRVPTDEGWETADLVEELSTEADAKKAKRTKAPASAVADLHRLASEMRVHRAVVELADDDA